MSTMGDVRHRKALGIIVFLVMLVVVGVLVLRGCSDSSRAPSQSPDPEQQHPGGTSITPPETGDGSGRDIFVSPLPGGVAGPASGGTDGSSGEGGLATSTLTTTIPSPVTPTIGIGLNQLTITASGIAPGDTIDRAVDLTATSVGFSTVELTTRPLTSSVLNSDAARGLQMSITRCSTPWVFSGPPYRYSCAASTKTVLGSLPWVGSTRSLANLSITAGGAVDHLRIRLTLPASSGNSFQDKTSTVRYTFAGSGT